MMRRTLSTYMFAAAAMLAAGPRPVHAQRERDQYASQIDTTIAFSRDGTVELQLVRGEIIVGAWSRDQVRLRATSERSELRFDASSAHLSVGLRSGTSRSGDTRFELTVPAGTRVRANTTSGDIRIRGSKAEVEVRTQRGDIELEDVGRADITAYSGDVSATGVNGELRANVLSGDVRIRQVTGDIEVKTVSGGVDLRDARSSYVRLGSTSGDISFDGTVDANGRYELQTHSGDVTLTLPSNVGAHLTVGTYSGTVESDFELTLQPGPHGGPGSRGKKFEFTLGRGGARITTESFSGDITIRSRGGPSPRRGGEGDQ